MVTTSSLTIRHYEPVDYAILHGWWEKHGAEPMHESMIPKSSIIVERDGDPQAFVALFPCNNNHVAFCHGLVARPGMCLGDTLEVLKVLNRGIDIMAMSGGHTLIIATVANDRLRKGAEMIGFEATGEYVQTVARTVKPRNQD